METPEPSSSISPTDKVPAGTITLEASSFFHAGPLPDPRALEYYEKVCPGAAREIIEMAKREQVHRHSNDGAARLSLLLGQIFGFTLGLVGLLGGIYLASTGKSLAGLGVFITSLGSLVGVFVLDRKLAVAPASDPPAK
jgi:uncharacterized membrane protein